MGVGVSTRQTKKNCSSTWNCYAYRHSLQSSSIASNNAHLFRSLQQFLAAKLFNDVEEVKTSVIFYYSTMHKVTMCSATFLIEGRRFCARSLEAFIQPFLHRRLVVWREVSVFPWPRLLTLLSKPPLHQKYGLSGVGKDEVPYQVSLSAPRRMTKAVEL